MLRPVNASTRRKGRWSTTCSMLSGARHLDVDAAAGEGGEDTLDVDVAVLDEDAVLVLRSADGRAGDVDARHVCFHRLLVEDGRRAVAAKLDAGELEQLVVLLVAGE